MKINFKRIWSLVICLALFLGMAIPGYALNETNELGITFSATLDTPTISESAENQTVVMRVKADSSMTVDGIGFTVTKPNAFTITSITGGDKLGSYDNISTNLAEGTAVWSSMDNFSAQNVENVTEFAVITFTVPANTSAGTYNLGISKLELTTDYALNKWENGASATTTLTITGENAGGGEDPVIPTDKDYTADLSASSSTNVKAGDEVTVDVLVGGTTGAFASAELELSYSGLTYEGADKDGGADISASNGTIKIVDHGETTTWSENENIKAYTLNFTVNTINGATGNASVTLNNAAFSTQENAETSNLTDATVTDATKAFTVTPADLTITLPEDFVSTSGSNKVEYGESFTFEAKDKNYTYNVTVSPNVTIIDNGDGTWTIPSVTQDLTITANKVAKVYTITFSNVDHIKDHDDATVEVTYGDAFSFTLKDDVEPTTEKGIQYVVDSIKYTETNADVARTENNRTYTIAAADITGNITITTSANDVDPDQFTVTKPAEYPEVTVDKTVVDKGGSVTVTLTPVTGYDYTVKVNGEAVELTKNGDVYTHTITNVTANIVITVEKTVAEVTAEVHNYLALNGKTMYLVEVTGTLDSGYVYTYGGQPMYKGYNDSYVYLVINDANDALTVDEAKDVISIAQGSIAGTITYTGEVNMAAPNKVDANDAQLVWNMYSAKEYNDFNTVGMEKFLRADVNKDYQVNVDDAAAIVTLVKARQ